MVCRVTRYDFFRSTVLDAISSVWLRFLSGAEKLVVQFLVRSISRSSYGHGKKKSSARPWL